MRTRFWLCAVLLASSLAALHLGIPEGHALAQSRRTSATVAQVYNGPGLEQGVDSGVSGIRGGDLKETIINITRNILKFASLAAVVVIVIAGIWLIVGLGEESAKEKAKKIVLYTIAGLILILIARAIVTFVIGAVA